MTNAQRRDDSGAMDTGTRTYESASLLIAIPQAVPPHMRDGMREVLSVRTPAEDQRKGYATALLAAVCEEADAARKVLLLMPKQQGDMSQAQLIGWYQRFGFEQLPALPSVVEGAPVLMARRVRIAAPIDAPSIATADLPPELAVAQENISEMRRRGVPLQMAVRMALRRAVDGIQR
jgi:hypothetical protein